LLHEITHSEEEMSEKKKLDAWVSFRLTWKDYELLHREAKRRHMKKSELIRAILLEWLKKNVRRIKVLGYEDD